MIDNKRLRSRSRNVTRAAAYHEAGHAVIAQIQGIHIDLASIIPDERSDGRVLPARIQPIQPEKDLREKYARGLLAGDIAVRRFMGRATRKYHAGTDRQDVVEIIRPLSRSDEDLKDRLGRLSTEAEQRVEENPDMIEAVADALVEHKCLLGADVMRVAIEARKKSQAVKKNGAAD